MSKKLSASIDLLIPSANIIKNNLPVFFILLVVPLLLGSITHPQSPLPAEPTMADVIRSMRSMVSPYMLAGSLLSLLFLPFLTYAQWKSGKDGSTTLDDTLRHGSQLFWKLLGIYLLMSIMISVGLFLFILPGIILLRCFVLAPYYLIQYKLPILEALKRSAKESRSYRWYIYGTLGIIVLFSLIGGFGVVGQICGTILTTLYNVALSLRFHEIRKQNS